MTRIRSSFGRFVADRQSRNRTLFLWLLTSKLARTKQTWLSRRGWNCIFGVLMQLTVPLPIWHSWSETGPVTERRLPTRSDRNRVSGDPILRRLWKRKELPLFDLAGIKWRCRWNVEEIESKTGATEIVVQLLRRNIEPLSSNSCHRTALLACSESPSSKRRAWAAIASTNATNETTALSGPVAQAVFTMVFSWRSKGTVLVPLGSWQG